MPFDLWFNMRNKNLKIKLLSFIFAVNVRRTLEGGEFPGYKKDEDDKPPMFFRSVEAAYKYLNKNNRRGKNVTEDNDLEEADLENTKL